MDREIPAARQTRQALGRWLSWLAAAVCLGIALLVLRFWIRPSMDRDEIRTARVERGAVSASGEEGLALLARIKQLSPFFSTKAQGLVGPDWL